MNVDPQTIKPKRPSGLTMLVILNGYLVVQSLPSILLIFLEDEIGYFLWIFFLTVLIGVVNAIALIVAILKRKSWLKIVGKARVVQLIAHAVVGSIYVVFFQNSLFSSGFATGTLFKLGLNILMLIMSTFYFGLFIAVHISILKKQYTNDWVAK